MENKMHKISSKIGSIAYHSIRGMKNILLRANNGLLKPQQLWIEVTDKCNARCQICNIWKKPPTKNIISPQEIEDMLSDDLFQELTYVTLSGGEPTLREDLEEIILRIHKVLPKTTIMIGTNGSLPDRAINAVKSAINHDINIEVGISIDGVWEQHNSSRGVKGLFEKIDRLIQELITLKENAGAKLSISVGFVLSDLTLLVLDQVKAYTKKMNVPLQVQWYNEASYYLNLGNELLCNKKDILKKVHSLPVSPIRKMGERLLKGEEIKFPCFSLYTFCLIKCNGDVVPCFNLWNSKIGNIRQQPPSLIWRSATANYTRKVVKECQGCMNACGVLWSFEASYYPIFLFNLRKRLGLFR